MNNAQIDFLRITTYAWSILFLYWLYTGMRTKINIKKQKAGQRFGYLLLITAAFLLVYGNYMSTGFLSVRFLPHTNWISYAGLFINISGIIFAIIARSQLGSNWSGTVTIKKDHELIQNGPYAITRHPIYTGLLFGLIGSVIILGEIRGLIAITVLFVAIQKKIDVEEKFLSNVFSEYAEYRQHTRRLIPFIY